LTKILFRIYYRKLLSEWSALVKAQRKAVHNFRRRLKQRGIARLEVNVRQDDAALVRNVVRALSNPEQEQRARALLREYFGTKPAAGLKALLAAAPLDGIELSRDHDVGRGIDL
jgi:hypothetical protein